MHINTTRALGASKCNIRKVLKIEREIAIAMTICSILKDFVLSRYLPSIIDPAIPATQFTMEAIVCSVKLNKYWLVKGSISAL